MFNFWRFLWPIGQNSIFKFTIVVLSEQKYLLFSAIILIAISEFSIFCWPIGKYAKNLIVINKNLNKQEITLWALLIELFEFKVLIWYQRSKINSQKSYTLDHKTIEKKN